MAGALGAVVGTAVAGEDLLAGLAGEVALLFQDGFQLAAVCDPVLGDGGVLGWQPAGDGLALLLPGAGPLEGLMRVRG